MPRSTQKDCSLHSGQHSHANRRPLDSTMNALPDNQSGLGRHKCAYCAYQAGYDDAVAAMRKYLANMGNAPPPTPPST